MIRETYGPVISLLTDFGLTDPFVGVMHGVIYSRAPQAKIVDLTHGVPPQDVRRAGYVLADSFRYFPPGTIHVCVVDPGVGSERRILAAAVDDQAVLWPDNGLTTALFAECAPDAVVDVCNPDLFLKSVSQTFHGRDKFAPAAGHMAAGMPWADYGLPTDTWATLDLPQPVSHDDGRVEGEVIYIDRFGNLVTNVRGTQLPPLPRITVGDRAVDGLVRSYDAVEAGQWLAIVGSTGRLEVAVNRGDAAGLLGAAVGERVVVRSKMSD